jgi:ATP-binding cassette, subfamily B (MDR/TAP), member 1
LNRQTNLLSTVFAGLIFPMWGLGFAYMVEIFFHRVSNCPPLPEEETFTECDDYWMSMADIMRDKSIKLSFGYLALIACALVGYYTLYWGFGVATERMNRRVREAAFSSLVRQEVAWFDVRSPGTITSRLSDDAAMLHAYSGEPIRSLVAALSSVLVGVVLSFVFMWYVIVCSPKSHACV